MRRFLDYTNSFFHVFFPKICASCNGLLTRNEQVICTICEVRLPQTKFHKYPSNPTEKVFWGRAEIIHGASFLFYEKGSLTKTLMQLLKYRDRPDIAHHLGRLYGRKLVQEAPHFQDINAIVPIPLHPKKLKLRGYNQCLPFAKGLGEVLGKEVLPNAIIRKYNNSTQTKKSRSDRWQNVAQIFAVNQPKKLKRKHILLVDDIITTGATLEACIQEILKVEGTGVSVATMAFTAL